MGSGGEKRGRMGERIRGVRGKGARVWFARGSMQKHTAAFSATI
jgi:hypothetical protein